MIRIIVGVGTVVGILALVMWTNGVFDNTMSVSNNATTTTQHAEPEEEEQYPAEWLKEAEAAKQAVLRKKELQAEQEELEAEIETRKARIAEIEKELGTY